MSGRIDLSASAPQTSITDDKFRAIAPERKPMTFVGVAALAFGIAALALAVYQPVLFPDPRGYLVSIVGVLAVALGLAALARARKARASRMPPIVAIALGVVGSAAMIASAIGFYPEPALELTSIQTVPSPTPVAPIVVELSPSGSTALHDERMALSQAAGTVGSLLDQTVDDGELCPADLLLNGGSVVTAAGTVALPTGAELYYSTSSDRRQCSFILLGLAGAVANYDSMSGTVTTN
jgi:ABC-type cobalamin transport system permease subunit